MKLIFFGPSKEVDLITQGYDKKVVFILDKEGSVIEKAKEGECVVLINFDFNNDQALKISKDLTGISSIKKIAYSNTRDLQKENIKADKYIKGPLNKAAFQAAYEEITGKVLSTLLEGSKDQNSGTNVDIQNAFDTAFSENEKNEPEAPAEESSPKKDDTIVDEESELEFSIGGMEVPKEEQAAPQEKASPEGDLDTPSLEVSKEDEAPVPSTSNEIPSLGDLEIPSIDEDMPGLELGGADEIVSAPVQDQGMDLDLKEESVPAKPEIKQEEKSPIEEPEPSLDFGGEVEGAKEGESREFAYKVPKSEGGTREAELLAQIDTNASQPTPDKNTDITQAMPLNITKATETVAKVSEKPGSESNVRLEAIIRSLREEREALLKEINENKENKAHLLGENLNLQATTEELKVELAIIKKRNQEEHQDDEYGKKMLEEKLIFAEEKNKRLQKDLDILNQKAHIDINKVQQKEKELEGQLELLAMDSQNQISGREKKISELKREVDALEFNMTNLVNREKKLRQEKIEVEEKLNKIMRTMRSSIDYLEDELDENQKFFKEIKK